MTTQPKLCSPVHRKTTRARSGGDKMGTFPPVRRKKLSETGQARTVLTTPLYTGPPGRLVRLLRPRHYSPGALENLSKRIR